MLYRCSTPVATKHTTSSSKSYYGATYYRECDIRERTCIAQPSTPIAHVAVIFEECTFNLNPLVILQKIFELSLTLSLQEFRNLWLSKLRFDGVIMHWCHNELMNIFMTTLKMWEIYMLMIQDDTSTISTLSYLRVNRTWAELLTEAQ